MKNSFLALFFLLICTAHLSANHGYIQASEAFKTGYASFVFDLNDDHLKQLLAEAPMQGDAAKTTVSTIEVPDAEGTLMQLEVVESPIMAPELAMRYPEIKTYKVHGEGVSGRIGYTTKGFHGILFTTNGTLYIDPIGTTAGTYQCYNRKAYMEYYAYTKGHQCLVDETMAIDAPLELPNEFQGRQTGEQLRKYRLALACTGEYSQFHGGTVPGVLSAMVVSMNRVNGVYEREFSITMELIANNDQLIFLNANTDPYTNNSGFAMLDQNQNTVTSIIGSANYDIGHVFSTGGGGVAQLASVCGGSKARGVTGGPSPTGDPFDIDYVAHEMGHQFGGNHTQNNECNRNAQTAVEPGSASTIMGYAGICAPNLQNNSDDYFHAANYDEIKSFSQNGGGNSCAVITNTGNTPPEVTVDPMEYTIPIETPFVLRGTATDDEGDDITYCWEQMDHTSVSSPMNNPSGDSPIFRSFDPVDKGERTFPQLLSVITGSLVPGELYPSYTRVNSAAMSFRLTARDNNIAGGGIGYDEVSIEVDGTKGPFVVNAPVANALVESGTYYLVEWDVASTDQAPINCQTVHILAYNGNGINFIDTVAVAVPNTGSYLALMPTTTGAGFRIRVEAADNVFFNLNPGAFTFVNPTVPSGDDIVLTVLPDFSTGSMNVSWTDPFSNETEWVLERSVGGNTNFQSLDTFTVNTIQYFDTNVSMLGTEYYYRVYALNPAGNSAYSNEDSWLGVGVSEFEDVAFEVYPNPTGDVLHIASLNDEVLLEIKLYNASGQWVATYQPTGSKTTLQVGDLPSGNYHIVASGAQGSQLHHSFSLAH